jgi:hypothetical protein
MGTRPQTLTALADSPVGLATFMVDHDARSLELVARSFNGVAEGLTRDDVLDNITLFWLTNTGVYRLLGDRIGMGDDPDAVRSKLIGERLPSVKLSPEEFRDKLGLTDKPPAAEIARHRASARVVSGFPDPPSRCDPAGSVVASNGARRDRCRPMIYCYREQAAAP